MNPYLKVSDIASGYTKMYPDKTSGKYFGKCPFCHADTATFSADNKKGTFFCYACGAGGDRRDLKIRLGLMEPPSRKPHKDQALTSLYNDAALFYYKQLTETKNAGAAYFKKRGINKASITANGLGFAPDSFSTLYNEMSKKYSKELLSHSGLFKTSVKGYPYDFFRNRVMFPIMDEDGDVIAFGGRVMDDSKPKYINSPETEVFCKRERLYGYPYKAEKRGSGIIICEGYMDYIAIHDAGIDNCAAVLGTAITEQHARLIAKDYKKVYLSMDSDSAGIRAAKKSISMLENEGLKVKVLDFRPQKDPDEFLRKNPAGLSGFMKRVENALPAYKFLARHAENASEIVDILMRQV